MDALDALWLNLRDDDADGYDREGYTPEPPDDDDAPIMMSPLRPMPRPEPVLIKHAPPPRRPAAPAPRSLFSGRTPPPGRPAP